MGEDKAMIRFNHATLVELALLLLRSIGLQPRIVGNRPDLEKYAPVIPDLHEQCGPLSGIEAGLSATDRSAALFVPVDVPLMPAPLLRLLIYRSRLNLAVGTMPCALDRPQPLCAIYKRDLLPAISTALAAEDYKVMRVIQQGAHALGRSIDMFNVETVLTASADFGGWPCMLSHAFLNCNTSNELRRAARLAEHLNIDDSKN